MKKLFTITLLTAAAISSCKTANKENLNFEVNAAASKAEWKGSAPDHFHIGSFNVTGSLSANAEGHIQSGDFIIPIASIQDFDLKEPVRQVLLADLKDNFFKLAIHPTAKFHITAVEPYEEKATAGDTTRVQDVNYKLTGNFTMLGQTHLITFPVKINTTPDSLYAEAKFNLDRTKWGMNNYNDASKKLYILPEVNIHLSIKAAAMKNPHGNPLAYIGY